MNGHTDTMEMKERADSNGAVLSDSSDGHAKSEKAILIEKHHRVSLKAAVKLRYVAIGISWASTIASFILGMTATVFAIINDSQSLFSFGLDSILDCISSIVVLWRFHGGENIYSEDRERRACSLIGILFILSAFLLAGKSLWALAKTEHTAHQFNELCHEKTCLQCFPTRPDTNRSVQSQRKARSFKFRDEEEEGLYYPRIENKGADLLCRYCTADLRLCFAYAKRWFCRGLLLQITLILSLVQMVVCLVLGVTKVVVGHKLESRALITDSIITLVGAVMSIFTLVFSAVYEHNSSLWYLDDSFGLLCSLFLLTYGLRVLWVSIMESRHAHSAESR